MTLQWEKSLLNRAQEERPVKRQNLPRLRSKSAWNLTVNPNQPLLGLLDQEFALGHDAGVVLVSPNDNPGRCPLTQKWQVMTAQGQPVTLGVG